VVLGPDEGLDPLAVRGGIDVPIPVPLAYYSFGGWKDSPLGDTHAQGAEGVHFFTGGKVVTSRWLDLSNGGLNLGFPQNS
jgi:malonate-semialdehyde dehydrogenase (acetylating)/methylmalonate-semialdehyde dehydrogenase